MAIWALVSHSGRGHASATGAHPWAPSFAAKLRISSTRSRIGRSLIDLYEVTLAGVHCAPSPEGLRGCGGLRAACVRCTRGRPFVALFDGSRGRSASGTSRAGRCDDARVAVGNRPGAKGILRFQTHAEQNAQEDWWLVQRQRNGRAGRRSGVR
jgi:hypothetical protein